MSPNYFCLSEKGPIRENNEDVVWAGVNDFGQHMVIACDGVGGTGGGEIASRITLDQYREEFVHTNFFRFERSDIIEWFDRALDKIAKTFSSELIRDASLKNMSTTLTMAIVTRDLIFTINVGDSRCYFLKDTKLRQISEDHNVYNHLKKINASPELWEKYKNNLLSITSTITAADKPTNYEIYENNVVEADRVFVCTDGLHNFVNADDVSRIAGFPIKQFCEASVSLALNNRSNDNISIAAVDLIR